jgi:hypothetical protein
MDHTRGNRNAHLESLSHFFDGLIADQRSSATLRGAVDFALDWVDLRAVELQAGQQRRHRQCGARDGHFTVRAGDDGRKGMGSDFEEDGRPILNDLMWPQATA